MWNDVGGVMLVLLLLLLCPTPHLGMLRKNVLIKQQQQQLQPFEYWSPEHLRLLIKNRNVKEIQRVRNENYQLSLLPSDHPLHLQIVQSMDSNKELLKVLLNNVGPNVGSTSSHSQSSHVQVPPTHPSYQNPFAGYNLQQPLPLDEEWRLRTKQNLEAFMILRNERKIEKLQSENAQLLPLLLSPHYQPLHFAIIVSHKLNDAIFLKIQIQIRDYLNSGSVFGSTNPSLQSQSTETNLQGRRVSVIRPNEETIETVQNENEQLLASLKSSTPQVIPSNVMQSYQHVMQNCQQNQMKFLTAQTAINAS